MSGRDLRTFITSHRARDQESLVIRMKNGLGSQKYKPVDYQHLQAITEAKKVASAGIEFKILKTEQAAKITKEQMLIKQHQQVWWQQQKILMEMREKAESELQQFLEDRNIEVQFLTDMKTLELQMLEDQETFKSATVNPIWELKDDLRHRLTQLQYHDTQQSLEVDATDLLAIVEQVEFVKIQQDAVMEKLNLQKMALDQQIKDTESKIFVDFSDVIPIHLEWCPEEVQSFDCPYPDLKNSIVQEFQNINDKYTSKLHLIEHQLHDTDRNCGWSEEDQWIFQVILEWYPKDLQKRRTLYLDMLQRQLPHKSRQELVAHERAWQCYQYAIQHKKALIQNWARDRKDLTIKAFMTLAEASATYESEMALAAERRRQQDICADLKEKVLQWRTHQEEVARLEAVIAERKEEEEEERYKKTKEKEMAQRTKDKERIRNYYAEKQKEREKLLMRDVQQLEQLKKLMAEQAIKDKERVLYRQDLLKEHLAEKAEMALHQKQEEQEREKRLDALRRQVAVVAEFDPVRMMGETEASRAKLQTNLEDEFVLQRPLFNLHTYSEQQVHSF
ncbi:coiled-coil domain-containing protein 148 [Protopterus annectens]|uniref:coiled-coil domain-containing protein 148 n=1 Tax=Protopterus annectens TaxID=7888 RepID=UPI001CFACB53|nr:coiled-coil domain-containing protein 148 [Protopterus annectens]